VKDDVGMFLLHQRAALRPIRYICCRHITHYQVLGVPTTASKDAIKSAYKEKAKTCHPDLNPDDATAADQFHKIKEAYDTLMDSKEKVLYDEGLRTNPGRPSGRGNYTPPNNRTSQQGPFQHSYQHHHTPGKMETVLEDMTMTKVAQCVALGMACWLLFKYTTYRQHQNHLQKNQQKRDEQVADRIATIARDVPSSGVYYPSNDSTLMPSNLQGYSSKTSMKMFDAERPRNGKASVKKVYDPERKLFIDVTERQWKERDRAPSSINTTEDVNSRVNINVPVHREPPRADREPQDYTITETMLRTMKTDMIRKKNEYLIAKAELKRATEMKQLQSESKIRNGKQKEVKSNDSEQIKVLDNNSNDLTDSVIQPEVVKPHTINTTLVRIEPTAAVS